MTRAHHTHSCGDCGTVTVFHCIGGIDDDGRCEYDDEPNEHINRMCERCYAAWLEEQEPAFRAEAEALKPFRPVGVEP